MHPRDFLHVSPLALVVFLGSAWATAAEQLQFEAGDLSLTLSRESEGIKLLRLFDSGQKVELAGDPALPLFTCTLCVAGSTNEARLTADEGWRECIVKSNKRRVELRWSAPMDQALEGISVEAIATADGKASAMRWELRVNNASTNCGVLRVVFPQVAIADLGTNASVLFPRGPGEVQRGVWTRPFTYRGSYPDGWCCMQFLAAYREGERPTGLYVGVHDPWGGTKTILTRSDPGAKTVAFSYDHPAPDMGLPGTGFVLEGKAVWQLLRGDWFDAASIYREWARAEAKWWPSLGREGRTDSSKWMRDLNAWAMTGGAPGDCVSAVKQFQELLGEPVGFHWYNWHQVPFDNDYPHYFPTKTGFVEGVRELKSAGVFPMPYINGRLWDSHDRGAEDFEFSAVALPSVTRKEDGSPYLESYGSKETNGQPVRLGVMCPATTLWRNTVSNIVLRLLSECGTSAVYIDQVAAAAPTLCMDRSHGHPIGGGHWWCEGYWKMLDDINRARPQGTMLTTECNGEPFIRWFDGYLTWHWQHDGQVPAFPAVYGGTIQMFGRAYRGGNTRDLALRMKAAQQLVYGEQLGWLDPAMLKEKENAEFFRRLVKVRGEYNRYFSAGEMARPPKLTGDVPSVRADWQWSGEWWVSTDAVLTGSWVLPREKRQVLLFVNVSEERVTATLGPLAQAHPLRSVSIKRYAQGSTGAQHETADGAANGRVIPDKPIVFHPREAQAWELTW